ncbi:PilC/PilY family type IV pilus protein [Moraxella sp. CTOTU49803]|uniref:PilC/PilY family type IV pilus protein n=1 Tax=Moraxella sp. CTOTU49803 TaxID=2953840 RepID=UPI0028ACDCC9|nr:PilC/PilY family type IV pilus protein [Moraxella sp. CTOTU49803]
MEQAYIKNYCSNMSFKLLPLAIGSLMVTNVTTHASDIELYKAASAGGATVMLAFDNSGSMGVGSILDDYNVGTTLNGQYYCNVDWLLIIPIPISPTTESVPVAIYDDNGNVTTATNNYDVTYCTVKNIRYYDRISRLKQALIPMLANPKQAFGTGANFTSYNLGLAKFYSDNYKNAGVIAYPAKPFTLDNRKKMIEAVRNLNAETNTPSAHAYAEVGSYMLGTTTKDITNSGFNLAESSSKDTNNYFSPVTPVTSSNQQQCGGNGIYFLTDGEPNSVDKNSAIDLMNSALNKVGPIANPAGTKLTVGTNTTCDANGLSSNSTTTGWNCMGKFSQLLRNTNNPVGREIITGTAGFGADFNDFANATKINNKYNCSIANSQNAQNLCKLGEKGYGFGEGGFYFVKTPDQLAASIKEFIAGVGDKEIPAISTGTMSVPLDALNTQQSRGFAYTPILDPRPGVTNLWDGNLKKYYIRNGTVTADGAGTKPVFNDLTGQFSTSTYDIWNTINDATREDAQRPDKALPQVGGAFQQVFEKSGNDRNLWVNIDDTLTNIKVDPTTKKPSGFTALKPVLRTDLVKPTTGTDPRTLVIKDILNNILVFTGFPAQTLTDMDDTTVLVGTPTKTPKNIGGVIHSLPQLVTYGIDLDTNGKFNATTRKDSVLYGSMDGALHLIDDSTGKEQFTFIPKEILDLQSGALIKSGKTTDSKLPYGVDAPWNVYTTYNITSNTTGTDTSAVTTNSYVAKQVFASGGLRMGGSTYYSLDITNPSTPSLIYSVGSNYANVLQGQASTIYGMKNGIYGNATTNTDEQKAYSRMGQTWGKPSVGFVRSGGKKVMVNFLPGGYDTRYETANFAADSSNLAQGNAVYMVRVGEEKEDSTTKKVTIDTTSAKGKLLWWASYPASKDVTTTAARPTSVTLQKTEHSDLTASIVTEIRTVDRNYDGYTDFIYFADLGGRVWRADINNNKDTDNFRVDRVVKLLDVSDQKGGSDVAPRFYERPLFTVTDEVVEGSPIAQITVGTGNRSLPVSDKRSVPDAIYSFMDREAGKKDLFCYKSDAECIGTANSDPYLSQALVTKDLTVANLAKVTFTANDATIKTNMMKGVTDTTFKHGWYYPFEQWYKVNGTGASAVMSNVLETDRTKYQGMKMLNEPDAQNGLLFVSVYNPNVNLIAEGCSATVQGATQRMLMCLPFGNCGASGYNTTTAADDKPDYTKRSAALAGAGIVDNIITQSKPDVGGSLFGVLQLSCTGTNCDKATFNKPSTIDINTINSNGVNRDKVMNPREWWEK